MTKPKTKGVVQKPARAVIEPVDAATPVKSVDDARFVHPMVNVPDPLYVKKTPDWFIGRSVKKLIYGEQLNENIWVAITQVVNDNLVGTVAINPIFAERPKVGDKVIVKRTEILAVTQSKEEWLEELKQLSAEENAQKPLDTTEFEGAYEKAWTPRNALRWWKDRKKDKKPQAK